ncbi:MAG TPA: TRAP transporter substrate-binding protein [Clostridia bacterium]|nr:TRAP transporter substrate-binding protein [Clostridia bacterium]
MVKRRLYGRMAGFLLLIGLLVLAGVAAGCSSGGGQQGSEVVELKLAHFFPSVHPVETELLQPWAKAIEEATGGRVRITTYPGETLAKATDIYAGVVDGIADIGLSCFSYTRGRFPVLEAFELPGIIYKNSKVASQVAWEGIQELNPQEVQDTKLFMVFATGSGDLFTKKPVRNLDDLQGMLIRATGLSAKTLQALGAVPEAMAQSEAYEALAKGVVHGNMGPMEILQGWKIAEVTDYITKTPFLYNTLFFITMNLDKWNSLPQDVQEAILKVNEEYFNNVAVGLWDWQNEQAFEYAVGEMGMEVIELSAEETERWIKQVEGIQNEYLANTREQGLPGDKALELVKTLAAKYNQEF